MIVRQRQFLRIRKHGLRKLWVSSKDGKREYIFLRSDIGMNTELMEEKIAKV